MNEHELITIRPTTGYEGRHTFGTANVVIGEIDKLPQPKPARANSQILKVFQQYAVLSPLLHVGSLGLQYTTSGVGDPGFSFSALADEHGAGWYVHGKLLQLTKNGLVGDTQQFFKDKKEPKQIDMVSGMCLFGVSSVTATTQSGKKIHITDATKAYESDDPIVDIHVSDKLHPSELESILRLTSFMESVGPQSKRTVYFHIPRVEYKLFGLDAYLNGLMSKSVLSKWCLEVDKRAAAVEKMVAKRLPIDAKATFVQPLKKVENLIQHPKSTNAKAVMQEIENTLLAENIVWKYLAHSSEPVFSPISLSHESYEAAYLQVAQKGNLTVAVDNPNEVRIYGNLRSLFKTSAQKWFALGGKELNLIALYPHPNVNLGPNAGINGKSYMLYVDGPHSLRRLTHILGWHRRTRPQ